MAGNDEPDQNRIRRLGVLLRQSLETLEALTSEGPGVPVAVIDLLKTRIVLELEDLK